MVAVTASVFDHQRKDYLDGGFSGFLDKPLRVEQVYACLSEHLKVTYTLAEADEPAPEEVDWTDIVLPSDLHTDLSEAIAHHNITLLRQQLDSLASLNDKGQSLAAHLHELAQKFDMDGIKTALEKIKYEG